MSDQVSTPPLSLESAWLQLKSQWRTIGATTAVGVAIAVAASFAVKPRYEVKAFLDKPYAAELTELNLGRSVTTGLPLFSPEQVYAYFTRRLTTDEAKQRFFRETYLPSLESAPETDEEKQAAYARMLKIVLNITPPPEKPRGGRELFSVDVEARSGAKAAEWLQAFLTQVSEDARKALIQDIEQSISLQIQNTERDLNEKLHTAELVRNDRQAQLTEALKVAQAVGLKDPQMTSAQPPRQDTAASFLDGSRLYARGTKSLQAELEVLASRKDDAPFVDGLRQAQGQINLLKELKPAERKFKIYHIDGEVIAPLKPVFPKKSLFWGIGLFLGLALGTLIALIRTGLLRQLLSDSDDQEREIYRRTDQSKA